MVASKSKGRGNFRSWTIKPNPHVMKGVLHQDAGRFLHIKTNGKGEILCRYTNAAADAASESRQVQLAPASKPGTKSTTDTAGTGKANSSMAAGNGSGSGQQQWKPMKAWMSISS